MKGNKEIAKLYALHQAKKSKKFLSFDQVGRLPLAGLTGPKGQKYTVARKADPNVKWWNKKGLTH
jgi:hypothetical protein